MEVKIYAEIFKNTLNIFFMKNYNLNFLGALHVHVDKFSKDGNVFVMALSPAVAQIASKKVHGNYFDGESQFLPNS